MRKIKSFVKKNYKLVIGFIIGGLVFGTFVYASDTFKSSDVSYDNKTSGLASTTLQGAIDELNEKIKGCKVIGGDGNHIGDEIKCGTESFYIIKRDSTYVYMLAKYNLAVGSDTYIGSGEKPTIEKNGIQNKYCIGNDSELLSSIGFASAKTCMGSDSFDNYLSYLKNSCGFPTTTTLSKISLSQLQSLNCTTTSCATSNNPWIYSTGGYIILDKDSGYPCMLDMYGNISCSPTNNFGSRPVVKTLKSVIK